MAYPIIGAYGGNGSGTPSVTTVECHKQVRSWRFLRFILHLLIPTCTHSTTFQEEDSPAPGQKQQKRLRNYTNYTGTIFGYRGGKVSFCIQRDSKYAAPVLLLELDVPTNILAKEMQEGALRIVLESLGGGLGTLLSTPLWNMYCNGKRVGHAIKRQPSQTDLEALNLMSEVAVGAGLIINGKENGGEEDDQLMYLRAKFHRVFGAAYKSESFHLIDPEGHIGQELSIFFNYHPI